MYSLKIIIKFYVTKFKLTKVTKYVYTMSCHGM